jgi:Antitoxin of toxin-antitoxin, RelE / RelB, TA system
VYSLRSLYISSFLGKDVSSVLATPREHLLHFEKFTDARSKFSLLFNEAVEDELPIVIERGGREHGLLVGQHALLRMLAPFWFHVDVLPEDDGGFTLWLHEFDIGGTGPTLKEARGDLLAAVVRYVRDYWQQFRLYRQLPEMAAKEPYVLRLSLADTEQEFFDVLFGPATTPAPTPISL